MTQARTRNMNGPKPQAGVVILSEKTDFKKKSEETGKDTIKSYKEKSAKKVFHF